MIIRLNPTPKHRPRAATMDIHTERMVEMRTALAADAFRASLQEFGAARLHCRLLAVRYAKSVISLLDA